MTSFCDAQTKKRSLFKKGNKLFSDSIYEESEINYRKSLEQDQDFFKAKYNLANSVFKQERYDESESLYSAILNQSEVKEENNKVQYNLATSQLKQNKFNEAIENYKKYIKKNPQDNDAIYNYCYAKKMLDPGELPMPVMPLPTPVATYQFPRVIEEYDFGPAPVLGATMSPSAAAGQVWGSTISSIAGSIGQGFNNYANYRYGTKF